MLFLGTYTPRLDDKGRLALPAKFRPDLEGGLVICKGQEHCLYVFPAAQFATFTQALANAPITDARVRHYGRTLFASAFWASGSASKRWVSSVWNAGSLLFGSSGGWPPFGEAIVISAPASLKMK